MPIATWYLETLAGERAGPVTAALFTRDRAAKGLTQRVGRRTGPPHTSGLEVALAWGCSQFSVPTLMVLLLDPGLGDVIQPHQGQVRHAFEHCHQAAFQGGPEGLLLGVLVRTVRQRRLMQDAQGHKPGMEFLGLHRGTVVGHQCPRQTVLLQGLRQPMDQHLGGLVGIPLQVADHARVIVHEAQQQRRDPGAAGGQHTA